MKRRYVDCIGETIKGYELLEYYTDYIDPSTGVSKKYGCKVRCCNCNREYIMPAQRLSAKKVPYCRKCAYTLVGIKRVDESYLKEKAYKSNISAGIKHYSVTLYKGRYKHRIYVVIDSKAYKICNVVLNKSVNSEIVKLAHRVNEVLTHKGKEGFLEWYQKEIANNR